VRLSHELAQVKPKSNTALVASACGIRAKERFAQMLQLVSGNTWTIVTHFKLYTLAHRAKV
jgi:hypothetical protein